VKSSRSVIRKFENELVIAEKASENMIELDIKNTNIRANNISEL
jgi:hypothetical protein